MQITKNMVLYAQNKGILVFVYTVNDPKDIQRMVDIGVDGIITDDVTKLSF